MTEPMPVECHDVCALPAQASGIVAGAPGTGKTTAVVERVRALVSEGLDPDAVLVLTPTRASATTLRDRLALAVGVATGGSMAKSVAALAFQIVRAAAVHAGAEPPQLLTGPDEDRIVQELLSGDAADDSEGEDAVSRWPQWLSSDIRATRGFRAELRAFIAEMTTLGIGTADLHARGIAEGIPVWVSLASFIGEYRRVRLAMRGSHRDAAGLVREAAQLLNDLPADAPALTSINALRVVVVDDAQELTLGGIELLEALRRRGIAVLAFGDPDVGSGAFRGASPENFARLAARLPVYVLHRPYRGTAAQREVLAHVTSRIGAAGMVAHRRRPTGEAADESVRVFALRSGSEEVDTIARLLRERHVRDGIAWEDCAVIAHDSRQVSMLEAELSAREVPTVASAPTAALAANRSVRDVLSLVDMSGRAHDVWDTDDVDDLLRGGGFDAIELRRLRAALRARHLQNGAHTDGDPLPTGAELVRSAMAFPIELELLDTREGRRAARIAETLVSLRDQATEGATAHELLWTAWQRSGRERSLAEAARGFGPVAAAARRDLDAMVALFQAAKRHGEREDGTTALAFIRGVLNSEVAEDRLSAPLPLHAVRVMTPAGALGTEFDTVVVAGVQERVWPNLRARGSVLETWRLPVAADAASASLDRRRTVLHDELRLFARAVSRARSRLIVTAVDDDDNGPSVLYELLPDPQPAPHEVAHPLSLRGLVAQHRRTLTGDGADAAAQADAAGQLALLADAGVDGALPAQWYGVAEPTSTAPLRDPYREQIRVSPSKISTLETCQVNWVISELGGDRGGAAAGLGTLIHAALEHATGIDEHSLRRVVDARWGELELEPGWREEQTKALAADFIHRLARYLSDSAAAGTTLLSAEPHFEAPVSLESRWPGAESAVLSGYIDRVELTQDERVVIVDLKTGQREATGPAAVAANPQLGAYQFAFDGGFVAGAEGLAPGGAKLVVLTRGIRDAYKAPVQAPFDDQTRAAFVERVLSSIEVMVGTSFIASVDAHCAKDHGQAPICRIHTIGSVSSA